MYSIEPVIEDYPDHKFLNVWLCDELHPQHLVHLEVPSLCDVPKTAIDKIFMLFYLDCFRAIKNIKKENL